MTGLSPAILIALVGVFIAVGVGAGSLTSWLLVKGTPEQKRLRQLGAGQTRQEALERLSLEAPDPKLARLTRLVPRSPQEMSRLQRRLTRAGYPHYRAVAYYGVAELLLPLLFGGTVLLVVGVSTGWPFALVAAIAGYMLPRLWVDRQVALRRKAIRNGLPDALDLLTVCVEAGSGLDQAIDKASEELYLAHPALATELKLVTTEVRAGKPRIEALRNLAKRTGVEDIQELVSMLTQTDRFGTSVADALRIQADTSRTKRRQLAEERAGKVSVKLVFPLALCLFPALYVVCFGPVAILIYRNLLEH